MPPLVQPQEEEEDAGNIAQGDVHDNAEGGAGFFCVQTVEELAFAVFLVELTLSFGDRV